MIAGAMALPSMSASDWVAKMTLAFFFRSVFSHSRSWPAKPRSSSASQPSSMMSSVGRPSKPVLDAVEEIGEDSRRGARADQPLGLEGLDLGFAETLGLGVEQPAPGTADGIGLQRLLQRVRLQQHRRGR